MLNYACNMSYDDIIKKTENFAKECMEKYDDSHSYEHVFRVRNIAIKLAKNLNLSKKEIFEIELASLVHDINDHKYNFSEQTQEETLKLFFKDILDLSVMNNIIKIACNVSLSTEIEMKNNNIVISSLSLDCVRDADRIESLGAIGISRYFTYGIIKQNNKISEVIENIESRTKTLMLHIKTDMGKNIANEKFRIIELFINDYKISL
jgi:uncharacterized protein